MGRNLSASRQMIYLNGGTLHCPRIHNPVRGFAPASECCYALRYHRHPQSPEADLVWCKQISRQLQHPLFLEAAWFSNETIKESTTHQCCTHTPFAESKKYCIYYFSHAVPGLPSSLYETRLTLETFGATMLTPSP